MANTPLTLRFLGALIEQLGAQMYPSATATVAELISNAWDAEASNAWVSIPLGTEWTSDSVIIVADDGHGMTREEAQERFLTVGRKRRLHLGERTETGKRLVHGRKGIGKLAAFGTATLMSVVSVREDHSPVAFTLDYDEIRKKAPGQDCEIADDEHPRALTDLHGNPLSHGTHLTLSRLRLKRSIDQERFLLSMARRFAIDQSEISVFVNDDKLSRFNIPDLQFRFPRDGHPDDSGIQVDDDGWAAEVLGGDEAKQLRWWIGFTPMPLKAEYLRGISVTARGKMLQRPFMFSRAQGTQGQLGQEYLVGEVEADWLDTGTDIEDDLILANRDQLQLEDERLVQFLEWGRARMRWALAKRNDLRAEMAFHSLEEPDIGDLMKDFTQTEQKHLVEIAKSASQIGEPSPKEVHDFMIEVIGGYKDRAVRELMERIRTEERPFQDSFWGLVREFSLIDARKNYSIILARLDTIIQLETAVQEGAREVPALHTIIRQFPWLVDPRKSLLGDEVDLSKLDPPLIPELDENGNILDFLFALRPMSPAPLDEILVVEIKRATERDGSEHRATDMEVDKFATYVAGVAEHYKRRETSPPRVDGLMIASNYTSQGYLKKQLYDRISEPRLEFKTWNSVIQDTKRLHEGWLAVTRASTTI